MYVMKRFVIIPVIIAMLMVGVASAQEGSLCPFGSTLQELAPGDYCSDLQFTSEVVGASTGGYVMSSTSSMYALNRTWLELPNLLAGILWYLADLLGSRRRFPRTRMSTTRRSARNIPLRSLTME